MGHYAENRKARFEYEIMDKYVAGIELTGMEAKSVRDGKMSLDGSFVIVRGGEAYLINANITPFQPKNAPLDYDPLRNRRLLLTKKELAELAGNDKNRSLTIVPLAVYNKGKKIKAEIALAKGKKNRDKRETIKKRESDRELRRTLKDY
ncbi:MAG TPA: SsrA-binding protein SmpB [Candidatus Paceibacterota bacterium]|nr:SsrA-binding protein SmpB [Candidatus Paceibacterota bacterium]